MKEGQPEGKKQRIGPEKEMPAGTDKKQRGKNMFMEKTPVALAVLAACAVVFILINSGPDSGRISRAVKYGCYDRALIYEGQWWRMVTVGFTHIQPWHLAMNLYALYNMSSLERYFGHGWFALLLLGAVAGGSIAEYLFSGIRKICTKSGIHQGGSRPGAFTGGASSDPGNGRDRSRSLCSRSPLCLLQRKVLSFFLCRRTERKPGTLCPAVP